MTPTEHLHDALYDAQSYLTRQAERQPIDSPRAAAYDLAGDQVAHLRIEALKPPAPKSHEMTLQDICTTLDELVALTGHIRLAPATTEALIAAEMIIRNAWGLAGKDPSRASASDLCDRFADLEG